MKVLLVRIFAIAMLTNSILAFGASAPCKDHKIPDTCSPASATGSQSSEDQHCSKKMKKEKKMKKNSNRPKEGENYPGYGIYG